MKNKEQQQKKRTTAIAKMAADRATLAALKSDTSDLRYRHKGESVFDYAFHTATVERQLVNKRKRKEEAKYEDEHKREIALAKIDMDLKFIEGFPDEHDGYEPDEPIAKMSAQVTSRFTLQENAIKQCLIEKGYELSALPKNKSGHPGVKSEVRVSMLEKAELFTDTSFDKAWKRLRNYKDINYEP